ncbi:uncharacterized protein UV8b_07981 [Ustilaginoidea virens]|uniref:Uncharacterized protein n=1 Tax=Ustilaginoidea virens TaxID=1159556 RepID=A0A8E5HY08_USTVR|nr:uncharacterized protein UV8b_07981 [Ustilaginoidea virens]QUC23740.1 hypothetical protein UV8b_07981 [Ustilaginoidea virens]
MARDRDLDNTSNTLAGGQSKRPPLHQRDSDSHSDTTNTSGAPSHHHRSKHHQKQRHVGRLHARVPSTKAIIKQHAHAHAHAQAQANGQAPKLNRRTASRPPSPSHLNDLSHHPPHRRATSDVKLPRQTSSGQVPKSLSQSSLKRNRSHVEVAKRTRSADKLKRTSSGTGIHSSSRLGKTQVHFDLGSDGPEDEWVDASGTNSPYLSRKGSLNSSAQSSLRQGPSIENSRPVTPTAPPQGQEPSSSSPNRETTQHKEYLTSRLLRRTPSHGAPPQMTADIAKAGTTQSSRSNPPAHSTSQRSENLRQRPSSMADLAHSPNERLESEATPVVEVDTSALVPKPGRRTAAPAAETSRTQQKLNLQRASSVLEPGQGLSGAGGVVGASPLIGVRGPGHDGGSSRDPRIGKLLERTGMEYLVVRRHQNPVARSLNRLGRLGGMGKTRRIPRTNTGSTNGARGAADTNARHTRNVSLPDARQPTPKAGTNGVAHGFDGNDANRLTERLSGGSLVGADDDNGTSVLLRNLWDKAMDLNAGAD